jgi:replicative DNA helicase Mcm
MIRLSESKARTRLSDTVTADDAKRACDLVEYALHQVGVDPESGDLDVDMVESGTSESQRQRVRGTMAIIKDLEGRQPAELSEIRDLYEQRGFDSGKFEHTIQSLKDQGDIYEPQTDTLRTT